MKSTKATAEFDALLASDWEWRLADSPVFATLVGDPRYDDRWPDLSLEAFDRRGAYYRDLAARLERIDPRGLDDRCRLDRDLLLDEARLNVESRRFPEEFQPLTQMGGVHLDVAEVMQLSPRHDEPARERLVARLNAAGTYVDQTIALMRGGLERGVTPPQAILKPVSGQIAAQIAIDPDSTPIARLLLSDPPPDLPLDRRRRFASAVRQALVAVVMPAFRRLQEFFEREYLPRCRTTLGLTALPDGEAWYAHNIRRVTSTDLDARAIHDIGLKEVARLLEAMRSTLKKAGHDGDLASYFHELRTDPRHFFTDKDALLITYRDLCKRIDMALPKLFRTLPRLPYGVVPVPAYSEKEQTTAYYQPGAGEAGRPGLFFANTYDLKSRPRWEMEALAAHEAVPGHHLQIALAQELTDLPLFRRHGHHTAYIEGWGLYAESLGTELGLYRDPASSFGRLTYEMWRAARLVIDTGLHAFGWTREQAVSYFERHAGKAGHDIAVEVDRYLAWPGQALAYKLGELKIQELRQRARQKLGARFDVRTFHDAVLLSGPLPLRFLEKRVGAWIDSGGKSLEAAGPRPSAAAPRPRAAARPAPRATAPRRARRG
jgi:uncharacterized protein (DUF885 family)